MTSDDNGLAIGEVARAAGVPTSTIRFYERRGLLAEPERVSGRRRYPRETVDVLSLIRVAKEAGFTLEETARLMHGFEPSTPPSERWRQLAATKLREIDERITELEQMRKMLRLGLECGCLRIEDCQFLPPSLRDEENVGEQQVAKA